MGTPYLQHVGVLPQFLLVRYLPVRVVTVAMTEVKTIDITFRLYTRGRNNSYDISAKIAEVETLAMTFGLKYQRYIQ